MYRKIVMVTALAVALGGALPATALEVTATISDATITRFEDRTGSKFITKDSGIVVIDVKSGDVVHSTNPLRGFVPASTMKIVTAAVALQSLGADFRFKTTANWNAETRTLFLVGSGDPLLRSAQLKELAKKVASALDINSSIKVKTDSSLFPAFVLPAGWTKSQMPTYVRPVSSLVVDDRKTNKPARTAAEKFSSYLRAAGIKNSYAGEGRASGDTIAKVTGYPVTVAIRQMLRNSNNDIAEMLFRDAAVYSGKAGTWESARSHATSTIASLGLKMDNITIVDGSGLSRANRLNTNSLAALLALALEDSQPKLAPLANKELLPVAGVDGTLRGRFASGRTSCSKGQVMAKTGTLRDVSALAGYARNKDGAVAAFSILVNKIPRRSQQTSVRNALDWMVTALVGCSSS